MLNIMFISLQMLKNLMFELKEVISVAPFIHILIQLRKVDPVNKNQVFEWMRLFKQKEP